MFLASKRIITRVFSRPSLRKQFLPSIQKFSYPKATFSTQERITEEIPEYTPSTYAKKIYSNLGVAMASSIGIAAIFSQPALGILHGLGVGALLAAPGIFTYYSNNKAPKEERLKTAYKMSAMSFLLAINSSFFSHWFEGFNPYTMLSSTGITAATLGSSWLTTSLIKHPDDQGKSTGTGYVVWTLGFLNLAGGNAYYWWMSNLFVYLMMVHLDIAKHFTQPGANPFKRVTKLFRNLFPLLWAPFVFVMSVRSIYLLIYMFHWFLTEQIPKLWGKTDPNPDPFPVN